MDEDKPDMLGALTKTNLK